MKKFKGLILGAVALLFTSEAYTPVIAGSADFAGPYIAIRAGAHGGAMDGTATNNNSEVTSGTLGKTWGDVGVQVGWSIPIGSSFLLGLDFSLNPGSGKINLDAGGGDSGANANDISVEAGDIRSASIMPMISVSDSSAVYIKAGISHADLTWTGDVNTDLNSSMMGTAVGIGSRTMYGTGIFIQTEAGFVDWDNMDVLRKANKGSASVDTESVYGAVSIGFRF